MKLDTVRIQKPDDMNFVFGMSHFIKTVEDIHEAIVQTNPSMKFGISFCEASGPCLIRLSGNDPDLIKIASQNAEAVRAGHTFFIFVDQGFPLNILNAVKNLPEVCSIFCATANPTKVIIADDDEGRGVMGVIDGFISRGVESPADQEQRRQFLRKIGYKF